MKPNDLQRLYKWLRKHPIRNSVWVIIAIGIFLVYAYLTGYMGEKGRQDVTSQQPSSESRLKRERPIDQHTEGPQSPVIVHKGSGDINLNYSIPSTDVRADFIADSIDSLKQRLSAIEIDPTQKIGSSSTDSIFKRAVAYQEVKDYKKAASLFEEVYHKKPDYPTLAIRYGMCLGNLGKMEKEKALAVWASVPKHEKYNFLNLYRGLVLFQLRRYPEASKYFTKSLEELERHDEKYWLAKGYEILSRSEEMSVDTSASAVLKFADIVDNEVHDLQRYFVRPGTKYELDPVSRQSDILRRKSASFLLLYQFYRKVMNVKGELDASTNIYHITFEVKNLVSALKVLYRAGRTLKGPVIGSSLIPIDGHMYLSFLSDFSKGCFIAHELENQKIANLPCDTPKLQDMRAVLKDIEKHNQDLENEKIADMAMLIRTFFGGSEGIRSVKYGTFDVVYNIELKDNIGLSEIIIESPSFLLGEKRINAEGKKVYFFTEHILIDSNDQITQTPYLKITTSDLADNRATSSFFPAYISAYKPSD